MIEIYEYEEYDEATIRGTVLQAVYTGLPVRVHAYKPEEVAPDIADHAEEVVQYRLGERPECEVDAGDQT